MCVRGHVSERVAQLPPHAHVLSQQFEGFMPIFQQTLVLRFSCMSALHTAFASTIGVFWSLVVLVSRMLWLAATHPLTFVGTLLLVSLLRSSL